MSSRSKREIVYSFRLSDIMDGLIQLAVQRGFADNKNEYARNAIREQLKRDGIYGMASTIDEFNNPDAREIWNKMATMMLEDPKVDAFVRKKLEEKFGIKIGE